MASGPWDSRVQGADTAHVPGLAVGTLSLFPRTRNPPPTADTVLALASALKSVLVSRGDGNTCFFHLHGLPRSGSVGISGSSF